MNIIKFPTKPGPQTWAEFAKFAAAVAYNLAGLPLTPTERGHAIREAAAEFGYLPQLPELADRLRAKGDDLWHIGALLAAEAPGYEHHPRVST